MLFSLVAHTIALAIGGFALFALWRAVDPRSPLLRSIIAGGFLVRAFLGALLFWVSYLELPIAPSMQLGGGFWFFGIDGTTYFRPAAAAAQQGLGAIARLAEAHPSVIYIKVLALFAWLFGAVPSVAIPLNLVSYLLTTYLIVRFAGRYAIPAGITAIPLVAISWLPSWVLWALQPMKDAFFCFLTVLFAFSVDAFHQSWADSSPPRTRAFKVLGSAFFLAATIYALAGIRWYYATIALGVAAASFLLLIKRRPLPELALRVFAIAVLTIVLAQLVVAGGGRYLPVEIQAILLPWGPKNGLAERITGVNKILHIARANFDRYQSAGTRIRAGEVVARQEQKAAAEASKAAPPPAKVSPPPKSATAARTKTVLRPVPVKRPGSAPSVQPAPGVPTPAVQPAPGVQPAVGVKPAPSEQPAPGVQPTPAVQQPTPAVQQPTPAVQQPTPAVQQPTPAVQQPTPAVQQPTPAVQRPTPAVQRPTPAVQRPTQQPTPAVQRPTPAVQQPTPGVKPARDVKPAPGVKPVVKPGVKAPAIVEEDVEPFQPQTADVPVTDRGRLISGLSALLLPRSVAERLGLVSIGGGRGLFWFVELDSVFIDVLLIVTVVLLVSALHRGAWRDPFVWYLIVVTIAMTMVIAYTISNFGTLFRHRAMLVATLAPIAMVAWRWRAKSVQPAIELAPAKTAAPGLGEEIAERI